MPKNDYSEEEDFFSQGFEKKGLISIWVGLTDRHGEPEVDTLQDLCGVGYYRLDDGEGNCFDFAEVALSALLSGISYSNTFLTNAMAAAKEKGIEKARWVTVQFDFDYDPSRVSRPVASDPVFLGSFDYSTDD